MPQDKLRNFVTNTFLQRGDDLAFYNLIRSDLEYLKSLVEEELEILDEMSVNLETPRSTKFYSADRSDEEYYSAQKFAYEMYRNGYTPKFSTGICDSLTAGYGRLDEHGYWEYPLSCNENGSIVKEDHL